MPTAETVQVTIFNQTYSLRSAGGAEHIREIARLVDERMRQIASHLTTHDVSKLAILVALNIADEMQSLKGRYESEIEEMLKRPSGDKGEGDNDDPQSPQRATWFDEIFDADISPKDKAQRLSSQVSDKLKSLRRNETPRPGIEETED